MPRPPPFDATPSCDNQRCLWTLLPVPQDNQPTGNPALARLYLVCGPSKRTCAGISWGELNTSRVAILQFLGFSTSAAGRASVGV